MQLYIYRQFISTLPVSLDESALLDGCSYFGLFTRIIFPLLAPATATVVIIKAITIINDMYIPYLYMPKNKLRTLTTFLMNYANAQQGSWQNLAAGIIIIMLPTIVIYLSFRNTSWQELRPVLSKSKKVQKIVKKRWILLPDGPIIDVKKEDVLMDQYHADLAWLENPEVFAVNRLEAHSDHRFYESREEADGGIMKLRQSLNGTWKFLCPEAGAAEKGFLSA